MIREKVIHPFFLEVGVAKHLKEAMMFLKLRCKPYICTSENTHIHTIKFKGQKQVPLSL